MEAVVIGCGVSGLTCAAELLKAGVGVRIIARDLPPHTTSNKAAAIWVPYRAEPADKVAHWAEVSYQRYRRLAEDPRTGVFMVELLEVGKKQLPDPFWLRPEYPFRRLTTAELPAGFVDGYGVTVPFIHSQRFLETLLEQVLEAGGQIETRELQALSELPSTDRVVVNCSGLGAGRLVGDDSVFPIRGQLVVIESASPAPYLVDVASDEQPAYILPRGDECFLGGTAQTGDWSLREDLPTRDRILRSCRELHPALAGARYVRSMVGLRPGRNRVRLEPERQAGGRMVIHNYGHGGSGFTVAWGCAAEVVRLCCGEAFSKPPDLPPSRKPGTTGPSPIP